MDFLGRDPDIKQSSSKEDRHGILFGFLERTHGILEESEGLRTEIGLSL